MLQFPSDFKLTYSETEPIRERDHFTMELRYNTVSVSYPTLYNQCDDEVYRDRYLVAYCCSENCRNKLDNIQNDDPLIKYMLGRVSLYLMYLYLKLHACTCTCSYTIQDLTDGCVFHYCLTIEILHSECCL